jgi:glycosyltransferase involved in cell wall biosynthesis
MNNYPLVSVVIPNYNSAEYIREAIESVIKQCYYNIEIIVVDDCSQDNSIIIVKELVKIYKVISLIELPKNSGTPSIPRNVGIKLSKGKYIAFLDSDDFWERGKLFNQIKYLESSEYFMCSTSCVNFINKYSTVSLIEFDFVKPITLWDQFTKYQTPTSSIVIRSDILKNNLFNTNTFFSGREDLLHSLILHSKYGPSLKICNNYVRYRIHDNQISSKKLIMMIKNLIIFFIVPLPKGKKYYKLFIPYFILSNIFLSIWLRVILKKI